jgi:hypothetical protein
VASWYSYSGNEVEKAFDRVFVKKHPVISVLEIGEDIYENYGGGDWCLTIKLMDFLTKLRKKG